MSSSSDFEARFFGVLSAVASLMVHAAVLAMFLSAPSAPPRRPDVVVEIISEAPRAREVSSSPGVQAPLSEDAPPALEEGAPVDEPRAHDDARGGFRQELRRREERFAADMAVRRERVAALERFSAERQAGLEGASSPASDGEAVYACGAHGRGDVVAVTAARPMARYADVVPIGLFPPRYLEEVVQVAREGGPSLGRFEMALPRQELVVQLESPAGAIFALGRRDARCLVGFSWGRDVFPLRFRSMPARYVGADDAVREELVDVELYADATFTLRVLEGDALGFTRGALYDQDAVARNFQERAMGARIVRDFFGALFGG